MIDRHQSQSHILLSNHKQRLILCHISKVVKFLHNQRIAIIHGHHCFHGLNFVLHSQWIALDHDHGQSLPVVHSQMFTADHSLSFLVVHGQSCYGLNFVHHNQMFVVVIHSQKVVADHNQSFPVDHGQSCYVLNFVHHSQMFIAAIIHSQLYPVLSFGYHNRRIAVVVHSQKVAIDHSLSCSVLNFVHHSQMFAAVNHSQKFAVEHSQKEALDHG